MKKSMGIRVDKYRTQEYLITMFIFGAIVFGLLIVTGTLTSGIHLVDDHEFFSIQASIKSEGVVKTLINFMGKDLGYRFRPLYWVERVFGVFILGCRARLWSLCKAMEAVISMQLLYMFARKMQVGKIFSIWFSLMVSIGNQSAVWWRLGPQESIGIVLFGIALLKTYDLSKERNSLNVISYVVILVLMSLQKEAFLITVPAMFLLLMAYESEGYTGKFGSFFAKFIKRHISELLLIIGVLLIEAYIILFKIGTDGLSYAGFSDQSTWKDYIEGIWGSLSNDCMPYILLLVIMILIIQIQLKKEMINQKLILEILFCIYILAIEQICYAKSTMFERYLIPWVVGIFYPVIIIGYRITGSAKRVMIAEIGTLSVFLLLFMNTAWTGAVRFAKDGQQLHECMDFIVENSSPEDLLTSVSDIPEEDGAMGVIMRGRYGYTNCDDIRKYKTDISGLRNSKIIFGRYSVHDRLYEAGLAPDDYNFFITDNYEVAIKKSDK